MTKKWQHGVTTIGALLITSTFLVVSAMAQPGPGGPGRFAPDIGWGSGIMGPGMMGRGGFMQTCNPRMAGFAEWRIERIERAVRPTEAQRGAFDALKAASVKAVETIRGACSSDIPATVPARLEAMEKRMESMLQALKTVRPAFDAFYASLNDEQKTRLNSLGPRSWRWRWGR